MGDDGALGGPHQVRDTGTAAAEVMVLNHLPLPLLGARRHLGGRDDEMLVLAVPRHPDASPVPCPLALPASEPVRGVAQRLQLEPMLREPGREVRERSEEDGCFRRRSHG